MASPIIYGIKNCNTMKKTFQWLEQNNVSHVFHDYKKNGADQKILEQAFKEHGWENVINRKGTSWRALPDFIKNSMNEATALNAAMENPSLIRRPLMLHRDACYLGFDEKIYTFLLGRKKSVGV